MKRKLAVGVAGGLVLGVAGAAAAAVLSGSIIVPDVVDGLIQGPGSSSCQSNGLTFTMPDPTWDNGVGDWAISTLDYSGVTNVCVNLATADLQLKIVDGNSVLASASATNMGATSGTLNLSQPVAFSLAANADFRWIVSNS